MADERRVGGGAKPCEHPATAAQIAERLRGASRVLVTTHPHPDGDAAGSLSAAMLALTRLGKDVVGFNPDRIPNRYGFLPCLDDVVRELPDQGFELTVLLDCTDERMFEEGTPHRDYLGCVVALDHHKTSSDFADLCLRDPGASSAGVVLFRVLEELGLQLDQPLAEALYCSLISDTGSFRYQNTNPEAMRLGARLLEAGVDPWRVASNLYESQSRGQVELLGEVLRTLRTSDDGLVAALTVTREMLCRTGCNNGHVDGMINFARGIEGVEVATLLRVGDDHLRVSMRSRGTVDVSEIAVAFGGGGHKNAAGFTVDLDLEGVVSVLFAKVRDACAEAGVVAAADPRP
jgi:phosphoesterase RecJ-like protein